MWNATGPDSNRNVPPGVVPDFNHPEDVYWTLNIVITVISVVLTTVFFCIRIYAKRTIHRRFVTEDCEHSNHYDMYGRKLTWSLAGTCIVAYVSNSTKRDRYSLLRLVMQVLITLYCFTILMSRFFLRPIVHLLMDIVARYGGGCHAWEIRKPKYYSWLKASKHLQSTTRHKLTAWSGSMRAP